MKGSRISRLLQSVPGIGWVVSGVRGSYRRKLAVGVLLVLLISGVATVGLFVQIDGLLSENVERSMTAAANAEADELSEWSRQNRLVARVLAQETVYASGNETQVRAHLRRSRQDLQERKIVNGYVIDRKNLTVETSLREELDGTAIEELPWEEEFAFRDFDDVRNTEPHQSVTGTTVVGYITPIQRAPGHLLVVTIDAASVFNRFDHPVKGGFTRVVDSNGTVVFADDREATLTQYRPQTLRAPPVRKGLRGESGFVEESSYTRPDAQTSDYVAAYAPVSGTDWVVIEHAPATQTYALIDETQQWVGIVGLIALIGLLGVVTVLGADVTATLSRLVDRARRIENGESDVTFETDRPDEFGDLNRALASTRDTLQQRFTEVQETRDALEASNARLQERSEMVSVLNRILRHNVRNDINVIIAHSEMVADMVDDEEIAEELETLERAAWDLATISEQTQQIKNVFEGDIEPSTVRVDKRLHESFERGVWDTDSASITVSVEDGVVPVADIVPTLPSVLADVVGQIVEDADGTVTVDVRIDDTTQEAASLRIAVHDDGNGLSEMDVTSVTQGEETPLKHAQGLELWSLKWTVEKSDGTLALDTADATLEIVVPRASEVSRTGEE